MCWNFFPRSGEQELIFFLEVKKTYVVAYTCKPADIVMGI